jgi:signal transduction histidine kinase
MPRRLSLRVRLAVLVALVSCGVLAVVGVALVWTVDHRMHDTVRREAIGALQQAQASVAAGTSPNAISSSRPGEPTIRVSDGEASDNNASGNNASGNNASGNNASLLDQELPEPTPGELTVVHRQIDDTSAYVAVTSVSDPDGRRFALAAAAPLTETERTLSTLRTSTLFVVPTLSLVLGALAAVIAGRALRPVAIMRAEADAISQGTLHRRLTPTAPSSELADLARTMNDMLDRLDRAATSQRQFLSDVSHELRGPLATIRGNLELALDDRRSLGDGGPIALGQIDRLDTLISDLSTLSRLDETAHTTAEDLDLEDLVAASVAAIHHPDLRVDTSRVGHARLRADQPAMVGLVRNLLDNAARHATSTVTVTLTAEHGHVELIVDDDGPGIPADQRHRVFDRFARLDDGRSRNTGGTGLGLAIAKAAAQTQGGTITLHDAPTGGARFQVTLPTSPHDTAPAGR